MAAKKKTTGTKTARADKQRRNSAKKAKSRPAGKSHHGKSQSGVKAASKPKRGGDRQPTSADMISSALRQTDALSLRQAGKTFAEIAAELGYSDHSGARNAVMAALRENVAEPNAEMRSLELSRLDALQAALWTKATGGDLGAVDRVLKLMERRAKIRALTNYWRSDDANPNTKRRPGRRGPCRRSCAAGRWIPILSWRSGG